MSVTSLTNTDELDIKTVDGILYGWGEWRNEKQEVNGYSSQTITSLLISGAIGMGRRMMGSMVPHGIMYHLNSRAGIYQIVDGFADTLTTQQKAVLLAYYSVMPRGVCTDEQRAVKLGIPLGTMKDIRARVRDSAKAYLQSRILIA